MKYTPLSTPCNCSLVSVGWAIEQFFQRTPQRDLTTVPLVVNLYVSVHDFVYARREIGRKINGELPPQVNILIDYELRREEWYVNVPEIPSYGAWGSYLP